MQTSTKGTNMRVNRILMAVVAIFSALAVALTFAPANAQRDAEVQAGLTFDIKVKDSRTLKAFGKASNWKRKVVQVQRAPKGTNNWTTIGQDRTDGLGKYVVMLKAGTDIPCTGKKFKIRAKKKGRASTKVDDQVWYCS